ncbi:DNA adenine methylase [Thioalkalivibrio sp. HK1]|uniref:DNA adenine methylase n=1 Tax=Thioalkalivibrio sp. HK1 TaxID=1469245 RepID=UPI0018CC2B92|nr:DNA adenine methylase [Thioalkalivibrio sp. HK1]
MTLEKSAEDDGQMTDLARPIRKHFSHGARPYSALIDIMCEAPEWNTRQCRRDLFLSRLASTGKNPYKRYTQSPLRYAGGKSLAVGLIVESIPANIEMVVSPFMGGGSVEIALARELGLPVISYDIFAILCQYWQVQISKPEELADTLMQWQPSQDTYKEVKDRLKSHWRGECKIKDKTLLAAHYWPILWPGFSGLDIKNIRMSQ